MPPYSLAQAYSHLAAVAKTAGLQGRSDRSSGTLPRSDLPGLRSARGCFSSPCPFASFSPGPHAGNPSPTYAEAYVIWTLQSRCHTLDNQLAR